MSLILESLKKSEAERQRGQVPGLFVQQAVVASRRRGSRVGARHLVLAVVAVALAAAAWWFLRPETVGGAAAPNTPAAAAVGGASAPIPPAPVPVGGASAPISPANLEIAPAPEAVGAGAPPTPAPMPAPIPAAAPTPPPTPVPAAEPRLPRLGDLPAGERNALPPLKVSMHVYADEPGQRFVILDGRRHAEGAVVSDGLVVQEIRREGVVLSLNGRELLLPRP